MNRITPIGPPNPEFADWEISIMLDPDLDKEKALAAKANADTTYLLTKRNYTANWRKAQ